VVCALLNLTAYDDKNTNLAGELAEVFRVRNAIAHGHAWIVRRGKYRTDPMTGRQRAPVEEMVGRKPESNETKLLSLPLNRSWLGKGHALTILDRCRRAVRAFESKWGTPAALGIDKELVFFPVAGPRSVADAMAQFAASEFADGANPRSS
jgi:hypothetical protein